MSLEFFVNINFMWLNDILSQVLSKLYDHCNISELLRCFSFFLYYIHMSWATSFDLSLYTFRRNWILWSRCMQMWHHVSQPCSPLIFTVLVFLYLSSLCAGSYGFVGSTGLELSWHEHREGSGVLSIGNFYVCLDTGISLSTVSSQSLTSLALIANIG